MLNFADNRPRNPQGMFTANETGGADPQSMAAAYGGVAQRKQSRLARIAQALHLGQPVQPDTAPELGAITPGMISFGRGDFLSKLVHFPGSIAAEKRPLRVVRRGSTEAKALAPYHREALDGLRQKVAAGKLGSHGSIFDYPIKKARKAHEGLLNAMDSFSSITPGMIEFARGDQTIRALLRHAGKVEVDEASRFRGAIRRSSKESISAGKFESHLVQGDRNAIAQQVRGYRKQGMLKTSQEEYRPVRGVINKVAEDNALLDKVRTGATSHVPYGAGSAYYQAAKQSGRARGIMTPELRDDRGSIVRRSTGYSLSSLTPGMIQFEQTVDVWSPDHKMGIRYVKGADGSLQHHSSVMQVDGGKWMRRSAGEDWKME